ncbi:hypothetical protein LTR36_009691 [Oleoguttula mirabilis]|uniref:P-loop containing nucleoside triphosphate hydrolase protein n=1 Tax=Oleoguttula mirabilis TaxID=1507867 RepID=A0AAV9J6C6_9PEZI|nr:hypothetical protein LTR36_009691 [Oleoguttula mirabilis]
MATPNDTHHHIYAERNEDPRKRQRTVPMEVLSLGYSRTGTMTLKAALEILGYPTWHWVTMAENPPDLSMWAEALEAKFQPDSALKPFGRAEFDNLLGHWAACTDQPAAIFAEELVNAYPDAKVVLVDREVEKWYTSFSSTVIAGSASPFIPLAARVSPGFLGQMARQTDLICKYYFHVPQPRERWPLVNNKEHFDTWRANARATYLAHNEMVRRVTPPERLLSFNLADGWEPLCNFLGKPVPAVSFPRVNETEVVQQKIQLYIAESFKRSAISFARVMLPVLVALVASVWWAYFQ